MTDQIINEDTDLLRFITCGSVDDGKSTLIGRLLWDCNALYEDQIAALQSDSAKFGTQGNNIDYALLVDGLSAEREQGITIDVAYRFFASGRRKFIVADTPGHEQYTRNMVTAASSADVAIILIDASKGLLTQTKRHAYLCSLMGIRHIALAINKMDLVGFNEGVFQAICDAFITHTQDFGFQSVTPIPMSALQGENITQLSAAMPWYAGPSLLGFIDSVPVEKNQSDRFAFPVQCVNRPHDQFRGFSGTIAHGAIEVGNTIRVTRSGQLAKVVTIITPEGTITKLNSPATAGQAITLTLDSEIDISRGDILSLEKSPLDMSDQFEAHLVWMDSSPGFVGRSFDMLLATQKASATITEIKYQVDVNSLAHLASKQLNLNHICVCNISISKPIVFDSYADSRLLGGFILIDRITNATAAAGLINHSLRRADNIHSQALTIQKADREKMNGHQGKVIWLTGLSGSGKSTLANALEIELHQQGKRTYILDGDNIRQGLNKNLGFTENDRIENIRRVAEVAKLMMDAGIIVITAFISPFQRDREMAKELIGAENFIEVYVSTPIEVCEQRDVKGLYKKARFGSLPNFSGITSPYEAPRNPDIILELGSLSIEQSVDALAKIMK
jgi:bifunctional enzyme CysN/CysC